MLWTGLGRVGWDLAPWAEFRRLRREMDRLFDGGFDNGGADYPAVSIWRGEDSTVVTAELPGVDPEDLDISAIGNTLTIRGSRKPEELAEGDRTHRRERAAGEFVRTVQLPYDVDAERVEAAFANGVLRLTCPRAEADKPRRIPVSTR